MISIFPVFTSDGVKNPQEAVVGVSSSYKQEITGFNLTRTVLLFKVGIANSCIIQRMKLSGVVG